MKVHVFVKKANAQSFIDKKNRYSRTYRWLIRPHYEGYIAYKIKKTNLPKGF